MLAYAGVRPAVTATLCAKRRSFAEFSFTFVPSLSWQIVVFQLSNKKEKERKTTRKTSLVLLTCTSISHFPGAERRSYSTE